MRLNHCLAFSLPIDGPAAALHYDTVNRTGSPPSPGNTSGPGSLAGHPQSVRWTATKLSHGPTAAATGVILETDGCFFVNLSSKPGSPAATFDHTAEVIARAAQHAHNVGREKATDATSFLAVAVLSRCHAFF